MEHWVSALIALLVGVVAFALASRIVAANRKATKRLFGNQERFRLILNLFGEEAPGLEDVNLAERRWRKGAGLFWSTAELDDVDDRVVKRVANACTLSDQELLDASPRVSGADSVRVITDEQNFPTFLEAIKGAKKRILIQTMLWFNDKRGSELSEALIEAAKRGVQVRVIVDQLMTLASARNYLDNVEKSLFNKLRSAMEEAGIQVVSAEAAQMYSAALWKKLDLGNVKMGCAVHMKFGVFDDDTAFVGSLNFGDGYLPKSDPKQDDSGDTWRDGFMLFKGSELALDLASMFAQHWKWFGGDEFSAKSPSLRGKSRFRVAIVRWLPSKMPSNPIQTWFTDAMQFEAKKLTIQSPYVTARCFWSTVENVEAKQAAKLHVITTVGSEVGDHPTQDLVLQRVGGDAIRKGVQLVDFHKSTWSHWKIATSAEHKAVFYGSSNLNERSLSLDWELNVLVMPPADAFEQASKILDEDLKQGRTVEAKEFKGEGDLDWTDILKDELTRSFV